MASYDKAMRMKKPDDRLGQKLFIAVAMDIDPALALLSQWGNSASSFFVFVSINHRAQAGSRCYSYNLAAISWLVSCCYLAFSMIRLHVHRMQMLLHWKLIVRELICM